MAEILSNHIKASLITEDISEIQSVPQSKCLTVQHFDYKCERSRNEEGEPYGTTMSATLRCTVRSTGSLQVFYERMQSTTPYAYTFLFNSTFDERKVLSGYEDAMIITGYIIDIEEVFDTTSPTPDDTTQMLLKLQILLSNITYVGKTQNNNRILSITK